jgi:acyl-CoA thioesterase-1
MPNRFETWISFAPRRGFARHTVRILPILATLTLSSLPQARAEPVHIVAIGASNTSGQAVGASNAYPAIVERMLRAKGYDVTVTNRGVTGDTSARILARVDSAVPTGTKVVLFDTGGGNDRDAGKSGDNAANKAAIMQHIRAKGATPIFAGVAANLGTQKSNPSAYITGDRHYHITAQSQARLAAILLPKVIAALGKKNNKK